MLKSKKALFAAILFVLSAAVLCACTTAIGLEDLEKDVQAQIITDYYQTYFADDGYTSISDIKIDSYYGTYNGCVAVYMRDTMGNITVITPVTVAGVQFIYPSGGRTIIVWKSGAFYSLQAAYGQGLLTDGDIKEISARHQEQKPYLYESD